MVYTGGVCTLLEQDLVEAAAPIARSLRELWVDFRYLLRQGDRVENALKVEIAATIELADFIAKTPGMEPHEDASAGVERARARLEREYPALYAEVVAQRSGRRRQYHWSGKSRTQLGEIVDGAAGAPRECPACRAIDELGIIIRYRRRLHCARCIHGTKRCAACRRTVRLTRYRIQKTQSGLRVDAYCPGCARRRQRVRYEVLKIRRPLAAGRVCSECGKWKRARDFYPHPTSAGGLSPTCRRCKDARTREYASTARGRAAGLRAARHYQDRRRRPARAAAR